MIGMCVLASVLVWSPSTDEIKLDWKGKRVTLEAAGVAEQSATKAIAPWAYAHGYALALSDDARSLVVCKGSTRANAALAKRVQSLHDELLGPSEAKSASVIAEIATDEDLGSLCDALATSFSTYASWLASVRATTGFVLPDPGLAAYLAQPKGIKAKEWHRENEFVHRAAALELYARYGRLPCWLEVGFAWRAEVEVCKDVYCFPGRSGFVAAGEHRGWTAALAASAKARLDKPFEYDELTGLPRGTYDADLAPRAWGSVEYLARHRRETLAPLLAELARTRDAGSRVTHADGTWETIANYEVPRAKERELVERIVHPEFGAEVTRFFAQGQGFRPKPPPETR